MNKICISIEQSQKLVELGIDVNTTDMSYATWTIMENGEYILSPNQGKTIEELQEHYGNQIIPAWTLAALLKVIPKRIKDSNVLRIDISEEDFSIWYDNVGCGVNTELPDITMECPVDAAFEMVCRLLENKKFRT